MFIPPANVIEDPAQIRAFIHAHGFATVISQGENDAPWASHLPLLLDESADGGSGDSLRGHMARANEQWRHFASNREVLCIFHGPHAYISPSWYVMSPKNVPTWNYAVVHVYGIPQVETDPAFMGQVLSDTTAKYEAHRPNPWQVDLDEPAIAGMMKAVVAFSIRITRLEAKFKLGQNRSAEDQAGLLAGLSNSPDFDSQALAQFIQRQA